MVVLSQYDDADYALALLERGVKWPSVPAQGARLEAGSTHGCDSRGCAGRLGDCPRVVEGLVAQRTRVAQSPIADLTARERDVPASMAEGKKTVVGSLSVAKLASRRQGECGPALLQVMQVSRPPQAKAVHLRLAGLGLTQVDPLLLPIESRDYRQSLT